MRKYRKRRKSYESAGRSPYRRKTGSKIVNGVIIAVVSSMILGILSGVFAPRSQGAASDPTDPTVPPVTDSYIPPSGTLNITSNGLHNVAQYESVNVNVTQTVPGGDCAAEHIIPVDELPTENIDTNAVYLCKGAYYNRETKFTDLITVSSGTSESVKELLATQGTVYSFNMIPTKTTDGILITDLATSFHAYYIEDEANVFFYVEDWSSAGELFGTFNGTISNVSEATADGFYALIGPSWTKYSPISGLLRITDSGNYDVANKETVVVDIPNAAVCGIWRLNDTIDFSPFANADYVEWVNFSVDTSSNSRTNYTAFAFDNGKDLYYSTAEPNGIGWVLPADFVANPNDDGSTYWNKTYFKTVNFGAEPQLVHSDFKNWLVANATPMYEIVRTDTPEAA